MLNVTITPAVAALVSPDAPEVAPLVLSAARGIVLDEGIAPAQALSLAADTVAHDVGSVSQREALCIAKAALALCEMGA